MTQFLTKKQAARVLNQAGDVLTDAVDYLRLDPIPPLARELRRYNASKFRSDLVAGTMVAIVTIPQAIGFALVVGLPATAVLATAIVGAVFCALFSGSRHLVFGPTNTITIILAGALATVRDVDLNSLEKVLVIGLMMGTFQLAAGFFKLGTLTQFISRTVIVAYACAVAALIGVGQLGNLFGVGASEDVSLPGTIRHLLVSLGTAHFNYPTAMVGVASLLGMILIRRLKPKWPDGLIVIAISVGISMLYELDGLGVKLVRDAGEISGSMPLFRGFPSNAEGLALIPALASVALAAAILGMLEAISITKNLAARSGQRVNPNQELLAMGAGNLAATAFGAMPGSASFVRSAVCQQSGGATQLAAMIASALMLAVLAVTSGFINYIPISTLAAYLVLVSIGLVKKDQVRIVTRATNSDAIVFWVTLFAALFLKLDTAVYVGVGCSLMLFLKKASAPSLVEYAFNDQGQLAQLEEGKKQRTDAAISIVHVEGELFFGAADLFQDQVRYLAEDGGIRVVILRMKNARHLDATSVMSLLHLHEALTKEKRHLLISGINPDVERVLRRSGAWSIIGEENIFPAEANLTMSTKRALLRAKKLLAADGAKDPAEVRIFYDKKRAEDQANASAGPSEYVVDYEI